MVQLDVDLDSETLTLAGGTGLASVASGTTVTFNIDSTVATLTGTQTLQIRLSQVQQLTHQQLHL